VSVVFCFFGAVAASSNGSRGESRRWSGVQQEIIVGKGFGTKEVEEDEVNVVVVVVEDVLSLLARCLLRSSIQSLLLRADIDLFAEVGSVARG